MNIGNGEFKSIDRMRESFLYPGNPSFKAPRKEQGDLLSGKNFRDIFLGEHARENAGSLRFSKHASERLRSRNINLSEDQLTRLSEGTDRARKKGINESLIMVDELAFIVSVKNNMVVTAVGDCEDKIFTNIDGAVIG